MKWPSQVMWMWAIFHASFAMILPLGLPLLTNISDRLSGCMQSTNIFFFFIIQPSCLVFFLYPAASSTIATYCWHIPRYMALANVCLINSQAGRQTAAAARQIYVYCMWKYFANQLSCRCSRNILVQWKLSTRLTNKSLRRFSNREKLVSDFK